MLTAFVAIFRSISQSSVTASVVSVLILSLVVIGTTVIVIWNFFNWINALLSRRTSTTFLDSSNRLILFLNISLALGGLAIIGNIFGFVGVFTRGPIPGHEMTVGTYLTFLAYVVNFLTAYVARSWLRLGYSRGPIRQRPVLIWALWLNVLLSVLGLANSVGAYLSNPDVQTIWTLALPFLGAALFIWICVLVIRLVQQTFGVTETVPTDQGLIV